MSERQEVLFLLGADGSVLWSDVGTASALPDSRARWEAIWERRSVLAAIAHSHPRGPLAFSSEDATTMEAIDAALGRPLQYVVVAPRGVRARQAGVDTDVGREAAWVAALRAQSGMPRREP
jgi:hypothetical protein